MTFVALAAAALTAVGPAAVRAGEGAATFRLGELIGLDLATIAHRLGAGPRERLPQPVLVMRAPGGDVAAYDLEHFGCGAERDVLRDRGAATTLVFRGGRLETALAPKVPPLEAYKGLSIAQLMALARKADPPAAARPGELPFAEGSGFLRRRPDFALPPTVRIRRACGRPAPVAPAPRPRDEAGLLQGLGLLPFAPLLPRLNAERRSVRRAGLAALAQLSLGRPPPGGLRAFASRTRGARVLRDQDPTYAVLVLDLGDEPSRNLARMNDVALAGVREGRVVWIARTDRGDPLGILTALCLDREGRRGRFRKGCSSTGVFQP